MNIEVPEDIKIECIEMQRFLESAATNDSDQLFERIVKTNTYLARSGKLLADVKRLQTLAIKDVFDCYPEYIKSLKATTANQFIQTHIEDVTYYVDWLDRLNRGFVHSGDNLRTLMSFSKEELRLNKAGY